MSKISVGNVFWNLRADGAELPKDVKRAIQASKKQMERTGASFKSVGKKLTAGITAPITGLGFVSLKMSADFDQSMRNVNSMIGLSSDQFKGLKDDVSAVAKELGFGLKESAGAAYQAISAGIPREELKSFLNVAGRAAVAGVTDLTTSVDGLTGVINGFSKESVSATEAADVLFTAVRLGKTTMGELSASISKVGPLADEMGVSFRESVAAATALTTKNTSTSEAMTQVRSAMVALAKPNEEMNRLFQAAGIESGKASIKQIGLSETYEKLKAAAEEGGFSITKAVGSVEGLQAVLGITGESGEKFRGVLEEMKESAGAMDGAFDEINKGSGRNFTLLMSNMADLGLKIGDVLAPVILPLVQGISDFVGVLGKADPVLLSVTIGVAGLAAAIGPLTIGLGMLIGVMPKAIAGLRILAVSFKAAWASVLGPVTLVAAALSGIGLIIADLAGETDRLNKNFDKLSVAEQAVLRIQQGWHLMKIGVAAVGVGVYEIAYQILDLDRTIGDFFEKGRQKFAIFGNKAVDIGNKIIGSINSVINGMISAVVKGTESAFNGVISIAEDALNKLVSGINDIAYWIPGADSIDSVSLGKVDFDIGEVSALSKIETVFDESFQKAGENSAAKFMRGMRDEAAQGVSEMLENIPNASSILGVGDSSSDVDGIKKKIGDVSKAADSGVNSIEKFNNAVKEAGGSIGGGRGSGIDPGKGFSQNAFEGVVDLYESDESKAIKRFDEERAIILAQTQITEDQRNSLLVASANARERTLRDIDQRGLEMRLRSSHDFFGTMAGLASSGNKKLAAIGKTAAIAQATIDTYLGANRALGAFPPPFNFIAAGAVVAKGLANIASIKSQGAFAEGGDFVGNRAMLVGEEGPELVVPRSKGTVLTNSETSALGSGGGTYNFYYTFNDANPERLAEVAGEIEARSKRGVMEAISTQGPERDVIRSI